MAAKSSSSLFIYTFTYDVFLSFRGIDTRYGFTGNLYKALYDKGIHTFFDDQELPTGDQITSALEKAIEESRIFIIVFSENYASSSFCLNELVYILKFSKQKGLLVLPIFYMVEPSDVRHHKGSFGKALANHEKKFKAEKEKLDRWKKALHEVANLSGKHFKNREGYEYEFIQRIIPDYEIDFLDTVMILNGNTHLEIGSWDVTQDESENQLLLKKQRSVDMERAETQFVQQQFRGSFLSRMWNWTLDFLISFCSSNQSWIMCQKIQV
ncbi:hypothetical protein VNO78_34432 [Psophocarpus tetragonolobus]|uniref:TIR domain-containing protein n=1 Tax=Psophocarpus tetragonolobus TaxID=3891 RepID=A0AAN9RPX1_PSOTE